jgi:predicted RecA/RadA family phage recombinase
MATNHIQKGDHIDFVASGNVASGEAVVIGSVLGVSLTAVLSGATGVAAIECVWQLPKVTTDTFTAGQKLTWDISEGKLTELSANEGDLVDCCVAIAAAGGSATTALVKLTPGVGVVEPASN